MSRIIKWLIPSSNKLARLAAEKTQQAFNAYTADREDLVRRYADLANQVVAVSSKVTDTLRDGKIDETETEVLVELYKPLFDRFLGVIQ